VSESIPPRTSRLPRTVIALGFTSFLTDIGSEMIFPLLPGFIAALGGQTTFLGLIEGVADATSSLLKLASGLWADKTPRKKPLVLIGYGIASAARPLMALALAPWHVLCVRAVDRIGKGIRSSPRDVLLSGSVPHEDAGRAFGFQRAMDHAGAVVGPLIATLLLSQGWSLRQVFAAAAVPGFLSVLCVMLVREAPVSAAPVRPAQPKLAVQGALSARLWQYLGIVAIFALSNSSDAFLLLRARELGVPQAALPLLWTAFHVVKVLSSYVFGALSDRMARPALLGLGWLTYIVAYLLFAQANEAWQVWALFAVYGSYYGLTEPVERALIKDLAPQALQGRAFGYFNLISGLCAIPAGLLTGYLWQSFSPAVALRAGAGLAALAALLLLVWSGGLGRTRTA
jgi:MFS family permease